MRARQAVSSNGNRQQMNREPDPQVMPKAERRQFSAEYKRRIVAEVFPDSESINDSIALFDSGYAEERRVACGRKLGEKVIVLTLE